MIHPLLPLTSAINQLDKMSTVTYARGHATIADQGSQCSSQLTHAAYDRWPSRLQLPKAYRSPFPMTAGC
jgi:hypothetical protein